MTNLVKLFVGNTKVVNLPDLSPLQKLKSLSLDYLYLTSVPTIFKNLVLNELWLCNSIFIKRTIRLKRSTIFRINLS